MERDTKYLSIVTGIRKNDADQYWLNRMQLYVNGLISQCRYFNIDAELIVIEWNKDETESSVFDLLSWPTTLGPLSIRFIQVPPIIHYKIENSDKINFFQYIAVNVGVRRARGKFVLVTSIDVLLSKELAKFIGERRLKTKCCYRVNRHDIGLKNLPFDVPIEKQLELCANNVMRIHGINGTKVFKINKTACNKDKYACRAEFIKDSLQAFNSFRTKNSKEPPFTNASGDFILMDRESWFALRGYPEVPKSQLYIDGLIVYMAYVSGVSQISLPDPPMRVYHVEHSGTYASENDRNKQCLGLDYHKEYLPWCRKMMKEMEPLVYNDENWGFAMEDFKESSFTEVSDCSLKASMFKKKPATVCIDLGCGTRKPDGYMGLDLYESPHVDIIADLNKRFPFADNTVDKVRAYDAIEHIHDKLHTMNEIWRVCKPGAEVDIQVPSTDGRGAFQDPTHVSFWNINSFFYYCIDFPDYLTLSRRYGFRGSFKVCELYHNRQDYNVIHVKAKLIVIKAPLNLTGSKCSGKLADIPSMTNGKYYFTVEQNSGSEPSVQPEKTRKKATHIHTSDVFHEWITKLATAQNRLYYRDQTPESLNDLVKLVDQYKPTKIVELGTLSGLSLRTWLSADTNAEIVAIDLSFAPLRQSREIIPVNLSRVKLLEQNILQVDFSRLWGPEDIVLLYVDAHDQPKVPIMEHVLRNAVPVLPSGSIVVVDDLWYSQTTLSQDNALKFFENTVINEIDPLQCFQGYYAPYWKGASFWGFREVIPLMEWVNRNRIELIFKSGVKSVTFEWPQKNSVAAEFYAEAFDQLTGKVSYNPVEKLSLSGDENLPANRQALDLCRKGSELYASGNLNEAMNCFQQASNLSPLLRGVFYAQAVILARVGQLEAASKILQEELNNSCPHPNAHALLEDIRSWTNKQRNPKQGLPQKEQAQAITIFTMPKPFKGHIDIIQRNAVKSWTLLQPRPEIILLGDDEGTGEIAREFGLRHIPHVERNEFGTPLLNSIFAAAEANSRNSILAYVNADIILMDDFVEAIGTILKKGFDNFLMVGQRWDIDISDPLDFQNSRWENDLKMEVNNAGSLHAETGVDYFVFPKGMWGNIPPFALGRTVWDNWLIHRALDLKAHVIDATQATSIIHQNHDYAHIKGGIEEAWNGEEAKVNLALAGGYDNIKSIAYARWIIRDGRLVEKAPALNEKGEELYNKGDIAGALAVFKKVIEIDPSFATAYNNLGVLYWQTGKAQKAVDHFEKALKIDLNDKNTIFNLGSVLTSLGKFEDARNLYSLYLQRNPEDEEVLSALETLERYITSNIGSVQEAYDKLWETKLNDPQWLKNDGKGRVEFCADFLKASNKINNNTKLLDIGCGRGTLKYFLNTDVVLYGVDISKKAILEAQKIYAKADVVDLNSEKLPYEENAIDIVTALDVIEHVFDPLFFLREIHRVLKPGGQVVLSTPNFLQESLLKSLVHSKRFPKTSGDSFPYDGGHIHFFTYQDVFDLMKAIGFATSEPIGPLRQEFDYEFKEGMVWVLGTK